ncbi:MAG: hypothetical protein IJ493_10075 [Clostridia bacterium]|nr:hypothetical protein [Clostridia bacterium]
MQSLLYKDGRSIPHADDRLTADLLLDTAFAGLCPDTARRKVFLAMLTNPSTDPEEIAMRSEVLHDFLASPNLLPSLRTELNNLTELSDTAQRERSRAYTSSRSVDSDAALASARVILVLYALTMEKLLHILSQIALVIGMYTARSERLTALKKRAAELSGDMAGEMRSLCGQLAAFDNETAASVRLSVNPDGQIGVWELTGLSGRTTSVPEKRPSLARFFTKAAPPQTNGREVKADDPFGQLRNSLFSAALLRTADLLDGMIRAIFDEFTPLVRELYFYESAAAYVHEMKKKRVPLTTPSAGETTDVPVLYDLLLCVQYPTVDAVVPNALRLAGRAGVIITGENDSGKTVYMRAAGCAQLLFQGGLPIPAAEGAVMSIKTAVHTRYAAAEKEFAAGNDAGRFEQEVRELAGLLNEVQPDSLLLANEIFQTTAYAEGAAGLYPILRYLERRGVSFILVSHLRELLPMFGGDALHMQTEPGYHMKVVE